MVRWTQYASRRRLVDDDVLKRWFSKKGIDSFEAFISWCHANALLVPTGHDLENVLRILVAKDTGASLETPLHTSTPADEGLSKDLPDGLTVNDEGYVVPKATVKKKKPARKRQPRKSSRSKRVEKK